MERRIRGPGRSKESASDLRDHDSMLGAARESTTCKRTCIFLSTVVMRPCVEQWEGGSGIGEKRCVGEGTKEEQEQEKKQKQKQDARPCSPLIGKRHVCAVLFNLLSSPFSERLYSARKRRGLREVSPFASVTW
jgi:hypothetical protein